MRGMKKITTLTVVASTVLLSACATQQSTQRAPTTDLSQTKSTQSITPLPNANNEPNNVNANQSNSTDSKTKPTAEVKLNIQGDRLIAKIWTFWNGAKQGELFLRWAAPKTSNCISTTFPITKYKETRDYSWAYRTLDHTPQGVDLICPGLWQAQVVYKPTQTVIASASLDVPKNYRAAE